jgi:hypothetical protein
MPTLTCHQIKEAVGGYNSSRDFSNDVALTAALVVVQSLPWSLGRLMEVCLVADWGTIQGFSFGDRLRMAQEIENCWPLLQWMRTLPAGGPGEIVMKTELVDVLCRYTRLLPGEGSGARNQLSFLSKYLHVRINDAFPIWDSRARASLGCGNEQASWSSYKAWLDRVRQEVEGHKTCCLEQLRLPGESLVRTLDKALYTIGRTGSGSKSAKAQRVKRSIKVRQK